MSEKMVEPKKAFSDFWLNKDALYEYIPEGKGEEFSMDLIQLAAYRRIVSNFVFILTHLDIPVQFQPEGRTSINFTDGKMVYLSSSIRRKEDFDWSVGIALHEASHILLTDFDAAKSAFSRIPIPPPVDLKKLTKEKNLSEEDIAYLCKWVWNYIEDRFIDSYIFKEAPGYRGYYKAMYDKFWNSEVNSKGLKSDAFRVPNLLSYEYRVINLTNPDTDLDALKGLREIAELIKIDKIFRLDNTVKRLDLAYKVVEIIVKNIEKQKEQEDPKSADSTVKKIHDKLSQKGKGGSGKGEKEGTGEKGDEPDSKEKEKEKKENGEPSQGGGSGAGNTKQFTLKELKELDKQFNTQRDILDHNFNDIKESITKQQEAILDAIEKAGIVLVPVGFELTGYYKQAAVDCIVVKKLTKQLIDSGTATFPLAARGYGGVNIPQKTTDDAVAKGFVLGKLLGKKLQIRGEENNIKYIRKPTGKIERRLLSEIGAGIENIFNKIVIEKYNRARLHISVDSSGSMAGADKWCPTMTCVVAICVAASMVENLDISVSFRSSINTRYNEVPYIVLAYDSRVDKISKVRHLFPFLAANGATPEGLAFEAIAEEFIIGKKSNEQDHYFLNLSDGEPAFNVRSDSNKYHIDVNYSGETGALHTKSQVDKIRSKGVKILSYFISSDSYKPWTGYSGYGQGHTTTLNNLFHKMYGRDAQFIDVQNISDIARTINKLFLSKV